MDFVRRWMTKCGVSLAALVQHPDPAASPAAEAMESFEPPIRAWPLPCLRQ